VRPAATDRNALRLVRVLLPIVVLAVGTMVWELVVRLNNIPPYVLPGPMAVFHTLLTDWPVLSQSLGVTLLTTLEGFIAAAVGGVGLALLFNQSKWLEYSLFPYAVILQVTPVIAIAPLLLIYLPQQTAVIVCAWIVGFFPVLSNTTLGLNSVDRNLAGLFHCHLCPAGANFASGIEALARKCAWKGKLMASGTISSEKIDLLVHGPNKPIVDNGFSDQFVLHHFETTHDLERLTPEVAARVRGIAITYNTVRGDAKTLARFPKLEIVSSFGVGYDHVDAAYARDHNIMVTNTPDVLTEEVADIAMGLLITTLREFVKADRYLRSGLWLTQQFPLSVGSLRDRKVGMVGMGRIGQAIARRLDASKVPVVYHSRKPADGVSYTHYPDLIEMAKAVDTLVVIVPGGAGTAKMVNADVMKALGPRGVIINVARGTVVDEQALVAALKSGTILAAGLDVFEKEPNVPDELKAMQNVVLLPHIGSASVVTRNAMDQLVVDNLKVWFAGKPPLTPVAETPAKAR
jgi:lactate dehydrogenase-like 2-hydroxyacid dehydrogenase